MKQWKSLYPPTEAIGPLWIKACKRPGNPVVLKDTLGTRLKAKQALVGSIVLGRRIAKLNPEQRVGLLLPTSAAGMLCNMACLLMGKTVVNLNYSASREALLSSIEQTGISTLFTSRRFLRALQDRGVDITALEAQVKLVMLEDLRQEISKGERLMTLLRCVLLPAERLVRDHCVPCSNNTTAVILFSSGSEGPPKGVMLSHYNLLANVAQIVDLLGLTKDDLMLGNLPLFHAFGLTATLFLPLLNRVPVLCHPDPTDAPAIAEAISQHQVTLMFGTSTFFRLYVRNNRVHPAQLASLRIVVAGAEKLQDEVRQGFLNKFDKIIYEGYGVTETAPVASVNLPEELGRHIGRSPPTNRVGSVGQAIPGTRIRIVEPDTFNELPSPEAGLILISGPQVMQGYLDSQERSREVLIEDSGQRWYATGDKGYLDKDGFLFIQDRYSRFAKISGEMISLSAVESSILKALAEDPTIDQEEVDILAVNLPDARKGETIVLLSTLPLVQETLRNQLRAAGFNNLALPTAYYTVHSIPILGSGKRDFASAKQLAEQLNAQHAQDSAPHPIQE